MSFASDSPTVDPIFLLDSGDNSTTWDFSNDDLNDELASEAGTVNYQWYVGNSATPTYNGSWLTKAQLAAVAEQTGRYKIIKAQFASDGTQDASLADSTFRATIATAGGGGGAKIIFIGGTT